MPPRRRISAPNRQTAPLAEQQHRQAQDDVNANLTQDREHAGDGRRGRTVGGGSQKQSGHMPDLMRKATPSTAAPASIRINPIRFHVGHAQGEVCHVERVPAVP